MPNQLPMRCAGSPAAAGRVHQLLSPGYQPSAGENVQIQGNRVGAHYFSTVGMHLLAGRDFTAQDKEKAPLVAIVNQSAARRYFPNANVIGRKFGYGKPNSAFDERTEQEALLRAKVLLFCGSSR